MKYLSQLFILCIFIINGYGQDQYISKDWELIPELGNIGANNIIPYDLDLDGSNEIIYSSNRYSKTSIKILDSKDGNYDVIKNSPIFEGNILWMELYEEQNIPFVYVLFEERKILKLDLGNLNPIDTILLETDISKFLINDVDEDNQAEIYGIDYNNVYRIDLNGNIIKTKEISDGKDLAMANVDEDSNIELVIAAEAGYVIDPITFNEKWYYSEGFGDLIELATIGNNNYSIIFSTLISQSRVRSFNAISKQQLWETSFNEGRIGRIHIEDENLDGNYQLIIAFKYRSKIIAYDLDNRIELWKKELSSNPVGDFLIGDFDGDNFIECIIGLDNNILSVFNTFNLNDEWTSLDFSTGTLGNIGNYNEDEIDDIIIGASSDNNATYYQIHDGASKNIIRETQTIESRRKGIAFDLINYNDELYSLSIMEDEILIYGENFGNFIIKAESDDYLVNGSFEKLDENKPPLLFLMYQSGKISISEFHDGFLNSIWDSGFLGEVGVAYQIGNFDNDGKLDLAYLHSNTIYIYDLESFGIKKEINLNQNEIHAFHINDYDSDGKKEIFYSNSPNLIRAISYDNNTPFATIPIPDNDNSHPIVQIQIENLDSTKSKELVILADKLLVYNNNDSLLYKSHPLNQDPNLYFNLDKLIIKDFDVDNHIEIITFGTYGCYEFELESEYLDFSLPTVKNTFPINETKLVSTNSKIKITFSESINFDSLSNIELISLDSTSIPFNYGFNTENHELIISPINDLPINEVIEVRILNTITDISGNPLDGNYNEFPDGEIDDYSFSFETGLGRDEIGPTVTASLNDIQIYKGEKICISGAAIDSSNIAISSISNILYSIDEDRVIELGNSIPPLDERYDNLRETFELELNSSNLDFGEHNIYLIARDTFGNWGDTLTLNFSIKIENPADWVNYSGSLSNTSFNKFSKLDYPIKQKFIREQARGFPLSKAIVVEDKLIYNVAPQFGNPNILTAINPHTNELIWNNLFAISDEASTPAFGYGNLYVQLGDHSDSKLACFDIETGDLIWETPYSVQWKDLHSPVVYNGLVYIVKGYYGTELSAYDAFTGNLVWTNEFGDNPYDEWQPAIYQDTIYAYAPDLTILNPVNGQTIKQYSDSEIPFNWYGYSMATSPIIDEENSLVILSSKFFVHGFDLKTKSIIWTHNSTDQGDFKCSPALKDGKLYILTSTSFLKVDSKSGTIEWKSSNYNGTYTPVVNENIVAIASLEGLKIFNPETMELKQSLDAEIGHLTLSENYLINCSETGVVQVFEHDSLAVSTNNAFNEDYFSIYPNPVDDKIFIQTNSPFNGEIIIYNANGQLMYSRKINNSSIIEINSLNLPNGLYYTSLLSKGLSYNKKIIVNR